MTEIEYDGPAQDGSSTPEPPPTSAFAAIPPPMRVSDSIIDRCRREIDSRAKSQARRIAVPFLKWRYQFLELGEGFQWGFPLGVPAKSVRVGRYAYIGAHCELNGAVVVGDLCMISTNVRIIGDDHRSDVPASPTRLEFDRKAKLTTIEAECWIGSGAVLKAGVTIGRGAVIGACALVTKSVRPYSVIGGVPGRVLRMRFSQEQILVHERALYNDVQCKCVCDVAEDAVSIAD